MLRIETLVPRGNRGILRLVNSAKVNTVLNIFFPRNSLEVLKEWAGLGYIIVFLTQRKS